MELLLTPTEIGDALDLEQEGIYPCSNGSIHYTLKVDNLLQAQLKKVADWILKNSMAELVPPFGQSVVIKWQDWQALLKECE